MAAHYPATSTVPAGHSWREVLFILVMNPPSWGAIKCELYWTSLDDLAVHTAVLILGEARCGVAGAGSQAMTRRLSV